MKYHRINHSQAFEFTAKRLPTMGTKQLSRRNVTASSSSIGMSNVYDIAGGGTEGDRRPGALRPIVIDGSNVAMAHGEATGKLKVHYRCSPLE